MRVEREPIWESKESKEKEIEKIVDKIEKVYDKKMKSLDDIMALMSERAQMYLIKEKISPLIPEIQPEFSERILNRFIERYKEKNISPVP